MTVKFIDINETHTVPGVCFDYRTGTLRAYELSLYAGDVLLINRDGQAYDVLDADAWETIQNYCTDAECYGVHIVTNGEPTEAQQRAYDVATYERTIYADCLGN